MQDEKVLAESVYNQPVSFKRLFKFIYPSVIMMVFTSVYGVVDGIFVSNFVGEKAFAAVNLIMPVLMAFASLGFMVGTGGAALIAKTLGEGDNDRANGIFSCLIYFTVILGVILSVVGIVCMPALTRLMQSFDTSSTPSEETYNFCVTYGRINMAGLTFFMLQSAFQSFMPAAEKPKLGLAFIVAAGLTNISLDALFIAGFGWGIVGAATATITGQFVGGVLPVFYFIFYRKGTLKIGKPIVELKMILKTCTNGSSEMMTNLSLSLVNILYNMQLMKLVGESGVSAYGVLMYVNYIFCAVYLGYAVGVSPIVSYNYGAGNKDRLKSLFKKSLIIIAAAAVVMFTIATSLSYPLSYIFVGYNEELFAMTRHAFIICSFMFLIMGFNIFSSAFFTALNNGLVSAIISFLRTLVMQVVSIMVLPLIFGLDGVWAANVCAECLAIVVSVSFLLAYRKKYGYA